jgi:hypothetical protein
MTRSQSANADVGRQGQESERALAIIGRHLPFVDLPMEEVVDACLRLLSELVVDLAADGFVSGLDRELCDPGAHRAETDNADCPYLAHGHRARS